jgi:outer membrane protein assembly factor BamB
MLLGALVLAGCGEGDGDGGPAKETRASQGAGKVSWLMFGRVPQRTHSLPQYKNLNPPLEQEWKFSDRVLIEFPPALHDGVAYLADKYGNVRAIRTSDRRVLWDIQKSKENVGPPSDVTGPAWHRDKVIVAFQGGELVAFDDQTGKIEWKRYLKSRLESSPAVGAGLVFVGTDKGDVDAFDAETGKSVWTRTTGDASVKASPSLAGRLVCVGNYVGEMFCLDRESGKVAWSTDTAGREGTGGFYASPAIAGPMVFDARDDGTVFAFDRRTGKLKWDFSTGGPIYGSPAVAPTKWSDLTVFVGSYDHRLYAIDGFTGRKLWSFDVGGEVPGTPTVVGDTVYTSSFSTGETIGIDIANRKKVFSFPSPGYTPMISDGENLFLAGYFTFHKFVPRR